MKKIIQCVAALLLVIVSSPVAALEVAEINKAIQDKGAKWEAGETSLSKLSAEELRRRFPQPLGKLAGAAARQPKVSRQAAVADLPAKIDWRNVNGHSYVTGVRNQAKCGACYAFAATAALESRVLITSQTPDIDLNLSEQSIVSCDERQYGCGGGYLDYAVEGLLNTGIPLESCYPFTSGDGIEGACGGCADWRQNTYRITAFENVSGDVEAMKRAIAKHGPIMVGIILFQDFLSYKSGIYSHVTGTVVAGHAVALVGYDDEQQCWIAKNSMGTDWGENGYFRIKAGTNESNIETEAYDFVYATVPGASFVLTPASADFGTLVLPGQSSQTLPFTITNNGSVPLANASLTVTGQPYSVAPLGIAALGSGASADFQVTYTARGGKTPDTGELQVVAGGVTRSSQLTAQTNSRPAQPVNLQPADGMTVPLPVTLVAAAFEDADGDAHEASQWLIWNAAGDVVYAGSFDAANKNSLQVPAGVLQVDSRYYWQVIYRDERGALSAASAPTSFVVGKTTRGRTGCFIATAAFGSPLAGQVQILREFRDRYLLTNKPGQDFVAWYYRHGPAAADYIEGKPLTKAVIRLALYPLIGLSFLLLAGYLPYVVVGLLLASLLFFRLRPKKSNAT